MLGDILYDYGQIAADMMAKENKLKGGPSSTWRCLYRGLQAVAGVEMESPAGMQREDTCFDIVRSCHFPDEAVDFLGGGLNGKEFRAVLERRPSVPCII
mmetsp:Transcript_6716/g.12197  ORF Transcript_6716/g.12197 Transcript_6716/m.12197 type:complete len:99 (+) Transcript_6716:414-710(+)